MFPRNYSIFENLKYTSANLNCRQITIVLIGSSGYFTLNKTNDLQKFFINKTNDMQKFFIMVQILFTIAFVFSY